MSQTVEGGRGGERSGGRTRETDRDGGTGTASAGLCAGALRDSRVLGGEGDGDLCEGREAVA